MIKFNAIKNLRKEIDVIIDEYNGYAYELTTWHESKENKKLLQDKMKSCVNKIISKLEAYEREIEKIHDDKVRIIIRMRCNGKSYSEIGKFIGYTRQQVYNILHKNLKSGYK